MLKHGILTLELTPKVRYKTKELKNYLIHKISTSKTIFVSTTDPTKKDARRRNDFSAASVS